MVMRSQSYVEAVPVSTTSARGAVLALRGAEVFARSRGPRASTPSLLDAERPALVNLALERILGRIGVLGGDHLDKAKATALAGVWVTHNVALLDPAVLLEEDSDLFLGQARVNAGDEEVGALVDVAGVATTRASTLSAIAVAAAVLTRRGNVTGGMSVGCRGRLREAESAYRSRPL
jgi:hexokinase